MALRDLFESQFFRPRNLIPAGATLLLVLVAWFGIQDLLLGSDPPPEVTESQASLVAATPAPAAEEPVAPAPEVEEAPIYPKLLVAKRDLQSGVMLVSELVEWREWRDSVDLTAVVLQDAVPLQAILGSVTRRPYRQGAPIGWQGIIAPGGPGFIGAVLEPGMRAVTIEVDNATTRANIIYPGDRVDVIMVSMAGADGTRPAAQSIVRDARVLAVGSTIFSLGRYGRVSITKGGAIEPVAPPAGDNYTLEVFPVDAERIALATATGRLTLAMRSFSPRAAESEPGLPVRIGELIRQPPPTPGPPAVRIIRGGGEEEAVTVGS